MWDCRWIAGDWETLMVDIIQNKIYCGDCMDLMKSIPSKSVDMILCDLPYGVTRNKSDIKLPLNDLWTLYENIITDTGVIALFAQQLFYVDLVNSNRKLFRYDLIWDKHLVSGFLNANRQPLRVHEQIGIFYKNQPIYNPQMVKGSISHSKGKLHLTKIPTNNNYNKFASIESTKSEFKYPTSILAFDKIHPSIAIHPTQKSVECLEWLIKTYTNENMLVLDNCIGSGSTAVACKNTNRNFIGIDIEQKYVDISKERLGIT